jgi:hypothetical protein
MIRRGLIAGSAKDWAWALRICDSARPRRRLSLREQNQILDAIVIAQDAEIEAKAAAERLPRRQLRKLKP